MTFFYFSVMKFLILVSLLLTCNPTFSQEKLLDNYQQIFDKAKKEDKNVILIFGHKHCTWCRVLDNYHASSEVKKILDDEFIIHKINILESKTGSKLYEYYNLLGTPAWMIYDSDKKLLCDGKDGDGNVIGYPYRPKEIDIYLHAISQCSKNTDTEELQILADKLKYYGDLQSQNNE